MHESLLVKALLLTAVPIGLAACASPGEPVDGVAERTTSVSTDCFTVSLARDFRALDDRNLIVYAVGRQPYHIELGQACFGLGGDPVIALRSRTDRMCGFAGDSVIVDSGFPERCSVLSVRRLDEDQFQILVDQFDQDAAGGSAVEVEVAELPEDDIESADGESDGADSQSD